MPPQHQSASATPLTDALSEEIPPHRYSNVGTSLGSGNDHSGTLGCFITIDGPSQGTYALTNGHVALPEQWEKEPKAVNNPPPFSLMKTPNEVHQLHQPSKIDVEKLMGILREDLEIAQDTYKQDRTAFHSRRGGNLSSSESSTLENHTNSIKNSETQIETLRKFDNIFGTVAFSSGRRFEYALSPNRYGFTMDWALVSLDRGRFGDNPVGNSMLPWKMSIDQRNVWNKSKPNDRLGKEFVPRLTGLTRDILNEVRKGDDTYVLKRGRSTGYRGGCINEYQLFSQETGAGGQQLYSTELAVLNLVRENGFSIRGDSGSVVWDKAGNVIGLMHAGAYYGGDGGSDWTAVTPIELVFKDIKALTGAKTITIN